MEVLIIEDDIGLAELIKEKVEECGFQTVSLFTGADAIKYLKDHNPYLMILDYSLSDLNGKEFITALQNIEEPIPPFIVSTGQGNENVAVEMMKLGAMDYLVKNSSFLEILPRVIERVSKEIENEDKRKQAEEKLKAVFDNSPFPVAVVDEKDQNIQFWSKSAVQLFGHDPKTTEEWYQLAYPDPEYRNEVIERWEPFLETAQNSNKVINTGEYEISCKDGTVKTCEIYAQFIPDSLVVTLNDITEKKKTEEAFKKNRELLSYVEKIGKVGGWEINIDTMETTWTEEVYNIKEVELNSNQNVDSGINYYTPESRPLIEKAVQRAIEFGEPFDLDLEIITAKGNRRNVHTIGIADFEHRRVFGFFQDITERKQIEAEVKKEHDNAQRYFEVTGVMITVLNKQGEIKIINKRGCEILGYSNSDELIGFNWFEVCLPKKIKNEVHSVFKQLMAGEVEPVEYYENHVLTKSGEERVIAFHNTVLFDSDSKITGVLFSGEDITEYRQTVEMLQRIENELRESEKKSKAWLDNAPLCTKIVDLDFNLQYMSPSGIKDLQIEDINEFYGKPYPFHFYPDSFKIPMTNNLRKAKETGEIIRQEASVVDVEGNELWYHSTIIPINDEQGQLDYFYVLSIEISERKKTEKAIIESQRLGAIGEMSSAIAHDFNNSLQAITSYLELSMLNTALPEKIRGFLETANSSASDAANRVKLLQRFGGKTSKSVKHNSVDINLIINEVIIQTRPLWKDSAEKNGITISLETDLKNTDGIKGNDAELKSVLYNIIKNSVEAIEKDGKIKINTEMANNNVYIRIIDTGKGMDEETRYRIFQPFFSTKGFETGRGLGLSGAYSIIKEHNGKIYAKDTALGKGTTIEISLPISASNEEQIKIEKTLAYKGVAKILWVDDDPVIREAALEIFEALGHKGDLADNGSNALEYLEKYKYDLVFTDIGMPGMSGWQLCDIINEKYNGKMKLAVLSGWGAEVDDKKMKQHGVSYVLEKPFNLEQLQNLINKAMQ